MLIMGRIYLTVTVVYCVVYTINIHSFIYVLI